ncbi:hypothetical protein C8J56DRAFT_1166983 [Mycena floridula]|nr:hypothetical protein C8J56DRAFT_1166983 [Mycena floridula]
MISTRSIIGPEKDLDWVEDFMPLNAGTVPLTDDQLHLFRNMPYSKRETGGSNGIMEDFNFFFNMTVNKKDRNGKQLFPNLQFVVADRQDRHTSSKNRIDGVFAGGAVVNLDERPAVQTDSIKVPAEFKRRKEDPFQPPKRVPFVKPTEDAKLVIGQLVDYADMVICGSYRIHLFQLLICGNTARFIRWDHSGAIVSTAFNYIKESHKLMIFLHRLNQLTDEQLGFDTRFQVASAADAALARRELPVPPMVGRVQRNVVSFEVEQALPAKDGETEPVVVTHKFLAWHHHTERTSTIGRGTRTIVIFKKPNKDPEPPIKLYYKEGWYVDGVADEADTLRELNEAQVPHIPTIFAGGATGNVTISQDYIHKEWNWYSTDTEASDVVRRVQRFFIVNETGESLIEFKSTKEFLQATLNAFEAHKLAFEKCRYLHCDISLGNIILLDGRGLLIDWEYAKKMDDIVTKKQPWRTGTWQFISTQLVRHRTKPHQLQDDLESFFHVVCYVALRYLETKLEVKNLREFFDRVYDDENPDKFTFIVSPWTAFGTKVDIKSSPALTGWIQQAGVLAAEWLLCSNAAVDGTGALATLVDPGPVPSTIKFHSHDALKDVWKRALENVSNDALDLRAVDRLAIVGKRTRDAGRKEGTGEEEAAAEPSGSNKRPRTESKSKKAGAATGSGSHSTTSSTVAQRASQRLKTKGPSAAS